MAPQSTRFGDDVKRSLSPERVSQKGPDVGPTFSRGPLSARRRDHNACPSVAVAKEGKCQARDSACMRRYGDVRHRCSDGGAVPSFRRSGREPVSRQDNAPAGAGAFVCLGVTRLRGETTAQVRRLPGSAVCFPAGSAARRSGAATGRRACGIPHGRGRAR